MEYKNGRIYKILNYIDDDIYVGSTCQPLSKRIAKHRTDRNNNTKAHRALYTKMRELGVDKFYIELIEECPCDNKEQLRAKEGEYIRSMGTLNTRIENRSKQQYIIDTKEHKREYDKEYRKINSERIKDGKVAFYENNKDRLLEKITCEICGAVVSQNYVKKHSQTIKHQMAIDKITSIT